MGANCCNHQPNPNIDPRYKRVLWIALVLNGLMFGVELVAGWRSDSLALLADSVDFFGDAVNYGLSIWVLAMSLAARAKAALVKAASMGLFGLWILGSAIERIFNGGLPDAHTMTVIGLLAFAVNLLVAYLLYAFRNGDSNMRSVWLCSRNDALGNIAVVIAALGVFGTGTAWPDLIVASFMAGLALTSAVQVLRQARGELRQE
jgi:cation diffusion facilitator family transporter